MWIITSLHIWFLNTYYFMASGETIQFKCSLGIICFNTTVQCSSSSSSSSPGGWVGRWWKGGRLNTHRVGKRFSFTLSSLTLIAGAYIFEVYRVINLTTIDQSVYLVRALRAFLYICFWRNTILYVFIIFTRFIMRKHKQKKTPIKPYTYWRTRILVLGLRRKNNHPIYTRTVNIYNVRPLVEPVYNPCGVDRAKRGGASAHVSKYI